MNGDSLGFCSALCLHYWVERFVADVNAHHRNPDPDSEKWAKLA